MGLTFKENCPDLRNTRVIDIIEELKEYNVELDIHDPWVDSSAAQEKYGINMVRSPQKGTYDGIIIAVAHNQFTEMSAEYIRSLGKEQHVLY